MKRTPNKRTCPNCKKELGPKESGHFAPPCMGDVGFYTCDPVGICANCGGTGEVENSIRGKARSGKEKIPCPTCQRRKEEPDPPLGWCPRCFAPGKSREKRPNGNDTCEHGHSYPSRWAVTSRGDAERGRFALWQLKAAIEAIAIDSPELIVPELIVAEILEDEKRAVLAKLADKMIAPSGGAKS